jgi:putative transposase
MLDIPRDRHGRFDPALIGKYQRRFPGFDTKIIALYARGMSTRDIQAHIEEIYGIGISPELVSAITDAVIEQVAAWQSRPLEASYAVIYFGAPRSDRRHSAFDSLFTVHASVAVLHRKVAYNQEPIEALP